MADTLKSYLIKLGFAVDENGWKGFNAKVIQSGRNVAELGAVSVATALEIGVAVEKVARHYEDLYYVSQRTGSSVSSLKAQAFGFSQIGLSAEQAQSAVEGFASAVRMNPGVRAMFQGMGIDTKDPTKAIGQLVDRLKPQGEQGYFLAARIAAMGGMDETTFRQMWANREDEKKYEEAHIARQKRMGLSTEEAKNGFRDYSRRLRDVGDNFSLLKDRIALDFLPVANWTLGWIETGVTKFGDLNVATNGWAGTLGTLAAAAGGAKVALIPLMAILRALGIVSAAGGASLGLASKLGKGGLIGGGVALLGAMKHDDATANHPLRTKLRAAFGIKDDDAAGDMVKFYTDKGWTPEQAAGIVANLHSESRGDHRAVGDGGVAYGLAQWHPDRQANFKRWAGHDIRESTPREQMEFVHYELTQGTERMAGRALFNAKSANQAGSIVSQAYERPADVMGEASRRGAMADTILASQGGAGTTINQTNNITTTGVKDPSRAADLAVDGMKRVNGNLTRNTASLFQ